MVKKGTITEHIMVRQTNLGMPQQLLFDFPLPSECHLRFLHHAGTSTDSDKCDNIQNF